MARPACRDSKAGHRSRCDRPLSVRQTDNSSRVRDGYIRSSKCGHARAHETRDGTPICRSNVVRRDRACTPIPSQNLHGKEGVDGSSPSEGSQKASKWPFLLPQGRTPIARASLNLSPRSVPNIAGVLQSWLEQRRLTSSSTSMNGRYPANGGRDIDASDTRCSTV